MTVTRWTKKEIVLLGTKTDAEVAKQIGRTVHAVLFKRRELGIAAHEPHSRKWSKRELALLGKQSDATIAKRLGVTRKHVLEVRKRLGIASANPRCRPKHLPKG